MQNTNTCFDFVENGYVDSVGLVQFVAILEDDFDIDDFVGAREFFAQKLISSNRISAEDDELYKMYEAERDASELGTLLDIFERSITFEVYKAYHIAKRLAGGTLYDSQGKEITLETFQYQQPYKKEE